MVNIQTKTRSIFNDKESQAFMTLPKAAQYLGISRSHLYKLTSKALITHYKPNGKLIYFKKEDLDVFVLRNKNEAIAPNKRH